MAILAKKIHVTNSAGEEQTVDLYGTVAELGGATGYTTQLVDGQECYAVLVGTTESGATAGRVQLSTGDVYAWGAQTPTPAYSYKTITSGSGTFTVPSGVSKLRVTCVGGGAGGTCLKVQGQVGDLSVLAGGATTFGSVVANGATAPVFTIGNCIYSSGSRDSGSSLSSCAYILTAVSYGTGNGTWYAKGVDPISGAGCVALTGIDGVQRACVGGGGYGDNDNSAYTSGCGATSGGSGFRTIAVIDVTPGQVLSYAVGAGGMCKRFSGVYSYEVQGDGGHGASPGSTGGILVEWGEGIE